MNDPKLGDFLKEVSNWRWDDFHRAEHDKKYTSNQAIIFGLVRSCAMQELKGIKLAIDRLDGKLVTPVRVEYPKVYKIFPKARFVEGEVEEFDDGSHGLTIGPGEVTVATHHDAFVAPVAEETAADLPSLSIRQTLTKMSDYPRDVPELVADRAQETDAALSTKSPLPPEEEIPLVKSVVAAHLLLMAQNRDLNAITEVFDQIDGKLAETIKLLGEDITIVDYRLTAPAGATRNADGIYQIEDIQSQDMWATKLGKLTE